MKGELLARGRTAEVFVWKDGQVLKLFLRSTLPSKWRTKHG